MGRKWNQCYCLGSGERETTRSWAKTWNCAEASSLRGRRKDHWPGSDRNRYHHQTFHPILFHSMRSNSMDRSTWLSPEYNALIIFIYHYAHRNVEEMSFDGTLQAGFNSPGYFGEEELEEQGGGRGGGGEGEEERFVFLMRKHQTSSSLLFL